MLRLLLKEFDFILPFLSVIFSFLIDDGLDTLNLCLLLDNFLFLLLLAFFKLGTFFLKVSSSVLSLQLFAHGESN